MRQSRLQKKITITEEEKEFIIKNHKHLLLREIARQLNMGIGKLYQNVMILGLSKSHKPKEKAVVIQGYFDIDNFFQHYKY